uniref:ATP synthase complex subunit 8 n=1 Tax=Caprella mutica TaxID=380747 RepID=E0XH05_9CRUS|nr:ATP synthase F0 subunit 8 [Caprella mutica]ADA69725.1 ATP synthase F0 subunit 8 [Caprella mutica]
MPQMAPLMWLNLLLVTLLTLLTLTIFNYFTKNNQKNIKQSTTTFINGKNWKW